MCCPDATMLGTKIGLIEYKDTLESLKGEPLPTHEIEEAVV